MENRVPVESEQIISVQVYETEASCRCKLTDDTYTLHIFPSYMSMFDKSKALVYEWPYRYIRRFGHSKTQFVFEAGRKCGSGEGLFKLVTADTMALFLIVQQHMELLKVPPVPQKTDLSRRTLVLDEDPDAGCDSCYDSVDIFSNISAGSGSVILSAASYPATCPPLSKASDPTCDIVETLSAKWSDSKLSGKNRSDGSAHLYDEAMCFKNESTSQVKDQQTGHIYDDVSELKPRK